jgi:hypothetical protein
LKGYFFDGKTRLYREDPNLPRNMRRYTDVATLFFLYKLTVHDKTGKQISGPLENEADDQVTGKKGQFTPAQLVERAATQGIAMMNLAPHVMTYKGPHRLPYPLTLDKDGKWVIGLSPVSGEDNTRMVELQNRKPQADAPKK